MYFLGRSADTDQRYSVPVDVGGRASRWSWRSFYTLVSSIEAMHVTSSTGCAAIAEISTASTLDSTGVLSVSSHPKRLLSKPYCHDGQLLQCVRLC